VDKTGLTDKYDVAVTWLPSDLKPEELQNVPKEMRPDDVSIFEAFEKQAGLKLETQKGAVQVVVVDKLENHRRIERYRANSRSGKLTGTRNSVL
jgi:uncharacterized protein (TIGR03435 family)